MTKVIIAITNLRMCVNHITSEQKIWMNKLEHGWYKNVYKNVNIVIKWIFFATYANMNLHIFVLRVIGEWKALHAWGCQYENLEQNHNNFMEKNKTTKRTKLWETTNQMRDNNFIKENKMMKRTKLCETTNQMRDNTLPKS